MIFFFLYIAPHPRWINSSQGSISAESQHQAHKKSNGVPQRSARHDSTSFNLIWAHSEWMEHEIFEIWDIGKMSRSHSQISTRNYLKMPALVRIPFFKVLQNIWVWNIPDLRTTLRLQISTSNRSHVFWHTWEDRSRKVNNDEPDLRFYHGNFWPVISQAVRKTCPEGWLWVLPFP